MNESSNDTELLQQSEGVVSAADIGIIGGYGISEDIDTDRRIQVETPYGEPTHPIHIGTFGGETVAFLSRHGQGREVPSHQINYRANMYALRRLGVCRILTATANGSYRAEIAPGNIAIPDDYIDGTKFRKDTYFDGDPAVHVSSYEPFCSDIRSRMADSAEAVGFETYGNVTVVIAEGPRFLTVAESRLYRQGGADVVGGSTYPEMALARELEMCYANFTLITDYDNVDMISDAEGNRVSVDQIDGVIDDHADECTEVLERTVAAISPEPCSACTGHLESAASQHTPNPVYDD